MVRAFRAAGWLALVLTITGCVGGRQQRQATPPTTLEVELRTADGRPATTWSVDIRVTGDSTLIPLSMSAPGVFRTQNVLRGERVTIQAIAPGHAMFKAAVWLTPEAPAAYTVTLRPLVLRPTIERPLVIGDFNRFEQDSAVPMVPLQDGRWRLAVPWRGGPVGFHVLGVGVGARAPWIPSAALRLRRTEFGQLGYAGVMEPVGDTLIFVLDTAGGPRTTVAPSLVTRTARHDIEQANRAAAVAADALLHSAQLERAGLAPSGTGRDSAVAHLMALADTSPYPRVRADAALLYFGIAPIRLDGSIDSVRARLARRLLAELPERYRGFGEQMVTLGLEIALLLRESVTKAAGDTAGARRELAEAAYRMLSPVARNRGNASQTRANAYVRMVRNIDEGFAPARVDSIIREAVDAVPGNPMVATLQNSHGSRRVLRVGSVFPRFRMTSLDDPARVLDNSLFTGTFTLVDFWGTWCSPCVFEMPNLHRVHAAMQGRGVQFLSLSADASPAVIARFRREKYPMPWLHAWLGADSDGPVPRSLGITSWPTVVLVDPTGTIVAADESLRGEQLQATLERFIRGR